MTLKLYYHPLSSFCQKALIAFYERDVPFEGVIVDLGDPAQRAALEALWPIGKFPVLGDEEKGVTVPEASLVVEYLDRARPGPPPMIPADADAALQVRLWDRLIDNYIHLPMQKVVGDSLRPEGSKDPHGVAEAKAQIARSWTILDAHLAKSGADWAAGKAFTLADCAAAPALFYGNVVRPFDGHAQVEAYFDRLIDRPSFARCIEEARPYWKFFPLEWPESYL
ncbi:MAG: glutathione S-transferase [Alphaproteobacteria bacterium]|nr:glutathione S-transferase [Alphaproteobacteria bacterium]